MSSGRGVTSKKLLVSQAKKLDSMELYRFGLFSRPSGFACTWYWLWTENGRQKQNDIMIRSEGEPGCAPSSVRLTYTATPWEGEATDCDYEVALSFTPYHFGGGRWWFVCPLSVRGVSCRRRCRILYLAPGSVYFGCRECHRLTYESRQRHRDRWYAGWELPRRQEERARRERERARTAARVRRANRQLEEADAAQKAFLARDVVARSKKIEKLLVRMQQ